MLGRSVVACLIGVWLNWLWVGSDCRADEQTLRPLCRELAVQASRVLRDVPEVGIDIKLAPRPCPYLRARRLESMLRSELEAIGLTINPRSKARVVWDFSDAQSPLPNGRIPAFRMVLHVPTSVQESRLERIIKEPTLLRALASPESFDADALAKQIVDRLCEHEIRSVEEPTITDMAGAHHLTLSSVLKSAVHDEILKRDVRIEIKTGDGESRILGTTTVVERVDGSDGKAIELAISLLDDRDEPLCEPATLLIAPDQLPEPELMEVLAPTGRFVLPEAGAPASQPLLQMAAGQQSPVLINNEIRCGESSAYGFQVHATELDVDDAGRPFLRLLDPFVPTLEQGIATIRVRQGQNLAIVMHNRDAFDAALKVEIDGVSSFAFAQTSQLPMYHAPIGQDSLVVDRWYFNDQSGHALMAGTIEQGAYRLRSADPSRLGKIRLTVHRAYQVGQTIDPRDEPYLSGTRSVNSNAGVELAIGRGPRVAGPMKSIELALGRAREVLTIVYVPESDEETPSSESGIE